MKQEIKKAKRFLNEHKKQIAVSVTGIAVGIIAYKVFGSSKGVTADAALNALKKKAEETPIGRQIDEEVFTEIAPAIENAILDSLLDKFVFVRTYDLDELTHKLVKINIETVVDE